MASLPNPVIVQDVDLAAVTRLRDAYERMRSEIAKVIVGQDQVIDELILSFTHNVPLDLMLPGIPPTGKHVELPHVVVMKFENGKIAHEHIYWDQASLLVQVDLLDPKRLPVVGVEQARKLLDKSLPSNILLKADRG